MSHRTKRKPPPTPSAPTASEPSVEHYLAALDAHKRFEQERARLAAFKPLTLREAANVLAGLRHLARLAGARR